MKQNTERIKDQDFEYFFTELHSRILQELNMTGEILDEVLYKTIDELIIRESKSHYMSLELRTEIRRALFHSLRKFDILQELLDDPSVTEIMVNGADNIFFEQHGRISRWNRKFTDIKKLEDIIQQIAARCNRIVNEASPIADARLPGGDRVHIILPPIALDGPVITIRRFPQVPISMEDLINWDSITREAAEFLQDLVRSGFNLFISGGTGAGKTTFLNALSNFIPEDERVVTVEDNAELQLQNIPNLVRLEVRDRNSVSDKRITIRDLIREALRMRPDRLVVGECRGGEALDVLQAMNTGHDGSMCTGHGNSSFDMLSRIETMCMMAGLPLPLDAIRRQIASGLDVLIHLGRMRDGSRRVFEIAEVTGIKNGMIEILPLYTIEPHAYDTHLVKKGEIQHDKKFTAT